jgi:hypothetical protein
MPKLWGDAWYSYDAFDNLASTRLTVGGTARATTHMFDPSTNLLSTVANSAGSKYNYGYRYAIGTATSCSPAARASASRSGQPDVRRLRVAVRRAADAAD